MSANSQLMECELISTDAKTISVGQGMVAQGLDLSYLGVSALWKSELSESSDIELCGALLSNSMKILIRRSRDW